MICINLDTRPDRWTRTQEVLKGFNVERFSGIKARTGVEGCFQSHLAVIRLAKERGYPWIAIIEDDVELYPEFKEEWPHALKSAWAHRSTWDFFVLGPDSISIERVDRNLLQMSGWSCTGFLIVNSSAYDKIIQHAEEIDTTVVAVDHYYSSPRFIGYTWAPILAYQRDSTSDVQDGWNVGATPLIHRTYKCTKGFHITHA